MKKIWKILIPAISFLIILAFSFGIYFTYSENKKLTEFIETKYDVDIACWENVSDEISEESTEVSEISEPTEDKTEAATVDKLVSFIQSYFDIDINDWDGEGEIGADVHDIYDDTTVIEAYQSGDSANLSEEDKYVLDTATEILDEIIDDSMTEYEKELAVYNWQVKYVAYDDSHFNPIPSDEAEEYSHLPYGVLKYHTAICVGNATTFKLFMGLLGIECKIIHSTDNGEHAWDLVKIEGDWYHVDVTFDGGTNGTPAYSCFNVPDSLKNDGSWPYDTNEFPEATATKYCYIYNNCDTIESIYDIPAVINEAIETGKSHVFFTMSDDTDWNYASFEFIGESMSTENSMISFDDFIEVGDKVIYGYSIWSYEPEEPEQPDTGNDIDYTRMQEIINDLIAQG